MSIDRKAYNDPSIFEEELTRVFSERLFAGTEFDFVKENSYRSLRIGVKALTVRRTKDGMRAFGNVCLHRSNLIDPLGEGSREFRCGYHGWSYDADGRLDATPLAEQTCIGVRALPVFPLVEMEGLYFLGLNQQPPAANELPALMRRLGITVDSPFHKESIEHACNWKLLVENVLEGYHLSFVHTESFLPAGFTSTGESSWGGGGHTSWNVLLPPAKRNRQSTMQRLSAGAGHFYRHGYVFPDLFLSNTNGLIGFLSHVIPISAGASRLQWSLFELPALRELPDAVRAAIKEEAIRFTSVALLEDRVLVEGCHAGLGCEGSNIQLQPCEGRIAHFHNLYTSRMGHV